MRQTLVQLTDELVAALDQRAGRSGVSRSRLVRDLLSQALEVDEELDRQLVEGYRRDPQHDARDAWGDLGEWTAMNTRRNVAALSEEDGGW